MTSVSGAERGLRRALILRAIEVELERAYSKHGQAPWGRHEFYGVAKEEFDELWDAIKTDKGMGQVIAEAIEVAAMMVRYLETSAQLDHADLRVVIEAKLRRLAGNAEGGGEADNTQPVVSGLEDSATAHVTAAPPATVPHPPRVDGVQFEKARITQKIDALVEAISVLNGVEGEPYQGGPEVAAYLAARTALLDQYAALQRRAEEAERDVALLEVHLRGIGPIAAVATDLREILKQRDAELAASQAALKRAAPDQETVAGESVEGRVVDDGRLCYIKLDAPGFPVGTEVTVTKRRRAQEGEG